MNFSLNLLKNKKLTRYEKDLCIKHETLNNLFFFEKEILGYKDLGPEHQEWCWDLEYMLKEGINLSLSLAPRITYKTTVRTKGYALWRLTKNPDLRILLLSDLADNSKGFLREAKIHCERNERFRYYFGDWVSEKWSESEIVIKPRKSKYSEGSLTAKGLDSTITSKHYDIIIGDDLVVRKDRESEATRKMKIERFKELPSLLTENGEIHLVGTRWHSDDLYHFIINKLNKELKAENKPQYRVTCQSALNKDGESNFPSVYSVEDLKLKEILVGMVVYACNYLNDPLAEGTQIFPIKDLKLFNYNKFEQEYINSKKHIDFYGFIDPSLGGAGSDYVCIIIAAVPKNGYVYILECKMVRIPPTRQISTIMDAQRRYKFKKFGIETNMFRGLLKKYIEEFSAKERSYIKLYKINQTKNKQVRIEASEPMVKQYVYFRDDYQLAYPLLMHQLENFPITTHDDGPDALEGLLSITKGKGKAQIYFG